ncbi:DUF5666 domain-containing protein [Spirillospora sp. CA-294931]|uniref:DUF5666 domain-containing protein n=1 Tax=Spirillospora sp. CA-294931 TaxID=3240042 RepID=UPI003D8B45D3
MRLNTKTLASGIGAASLLGLGLYLAVPAAANPSPSPSRPAAAEDGKPRPPKDGKMRHHRPGRFAHGLRGVHGEATVKRDKTFKLATWQRGAVTGVSGATVTVRSEDGVAWQWTTDANTKVRKDRQKSEVSKLANGDQVVVIGERSGNTRTAKFIGTPRKK